MKILVIQIDGSYAQAVEKCKEAAANGYVPILAGKSAAAEIIALADQHRTLQAQPELTP